MGDMTDSHERYPIQEAERVIAERLAGGSAVLGIEGFWTRDNGVRPDLDYIADFGPGGLTDQSATAAVLRGWPWTMRSASNTVRDAGLTGRPDISRRVRLVSGTPWPGRERSRRVGNPRGTRFAGMSPRACR